MKSICALQGNCRVFQPHQNFLSQVSNVQDTFFYSLTTIHDSGVEKMQLKSATHAQIHTYIFLCYSYAVFLFKFAC